MRRFNVTVNGKVYDVAVEEIGGAVSAPAAAPAPVAAPAPAAAPAPVAAGNGTPVKAPMPGTIVKVKVAAGQAVKNGDVVCVIEAMKMESDICAPCDGSVTSVIVKNGDAVKTDDILLTIA